MAVVDVQRVFRALAEARDRDFYALWCDLASVWPKPFPEITFRIYQVSDSADAKVVLWVAGTRPDGTEYTWGLAVDLRSETITVETAIDVGSPEGAEVDDQVFGRFAESDDPAQAAELIRTMVAEVCGQRWPVDQDVIPPGVGHAQERPPAGWPQSAADVGAGGDRVGVLDVRRVFRALGEVRDKDFYPLWCDLISVRWTDVPSSPFPEFKFSIYPLADPADATVAITVEGARPDGTEGTWSLVVTAQSEAVTVETYVRVGASRGGDDYEVFSGFAESDDPEQAADLIRAMAAELCAQRWPMSQDVIPSG